EPEPECDLEIESEPRLSAHSLENEQYRGHHAAHFHHEHHGIAHHGHGMQLNHRIPRRAAHNLHVPQTAFCFRHICLKYFPKKACLEGFARHHQQVFENWSQTECGEKRQCSHNHHYTDQQ